MNKSEIEFANEQRERLIEIIKAADDYTLSLDDELADYLISNGVVVREKGEWVEKQRAHYFKCDKCKCPIPYKFGWRLYNGVVENKRFYNFCPNCGADMRGVQHEL